MFDGNHVSDMLWNQNFNFVDLVLFDAKLFSSSKDLRALHDQFIKKLISACGIESSSQLLHAATKPQQMQTQTTWLEKNLFILTVDRVLACQTVLAGSLGCFLTFDHLLKSMVSPGRGRCPPEFGLSLTARLGNNL